MGLTPNVVANTPIASAWGNETRDRALQVFTNAAERSAQWIAPPEGAHSYLADVDRIEVFTGSPLAWTDLSLVSGKGPRGEVGFFRQPGDVGLPGGAAINLNFGIALCPLVQNRKYRATFYTQISFTAAATVNLAIEVANGPGAAPPSYGIVQRLTFDSAAGTFKSVSIIARWVHTLASGAYNINIFGGTTATATLVQGAGAFIDLTVEDIGA